MPNRKAKENKMARKRKHLEIRAWKRRQKIKRREQRDVRHKDK